MFQNLKHRSGHYSNWHDIPNANNYHLSPGVSTGNPKGNEGSRMVRCRICGFPCDKERDSRAKDGSWAGLGVSYGQQLTAGTSIGDALGSVPGQVDYLLDTDGSFILDDNGDKIIVEESQSMFGKVPDKYYEITHRGGCPSCGCLTYDL